MSLNYHLKNINSEKETNIILNFNYNSKRLKYFSGIKIIPKQWSTKRQLIYSTGRKSTILNEELRLIKNELENEYKRQIKKGVIPEPKYFTDYLDRKFKAINKIAENDFYSYYNELIENKSKFFEKSTIKKYHALLNHLKNIEKYYNIKLNLDSFTKEFYQKFIDYFINEHQHLNSTIKEKHIKTINAVLNWFVEQDYINKNHFKGIKFPYKINPADTVSLSEDELNKLYNLDLENNKRLRQVRDVFCLECYTGLRYSDTKKINKDSITGKLLNIHTQKTTDFLKIPLRAEALKIINKYFDNNLQLPIITNQNMNDYIKELGKLCEFETSVNILEISGKQKTKFVKKKYELLTTHTGRRTFITLAYKNDMKPLDIMKITGHKSYDTFIKYYRLDEIDVHENFFDTWENIQTKYNNSEIIKNLIIKKVSFKTIAYSFGIDVEEIKNMVE